MLSVVISLLSGGRRNRGNDRLVQPEILLGNLSAVDSHYLPDLPYRLYLGKLDDEKRHVEEIAGLHLRTIEALALAIEAKDQTTHDHLRRVRIYAIEIGKEHRACPKSELEALHAAALLHDIGKLAVPEHIISKPGKLTPEEFEKMKIHPVVGAEILERVRIPVSGGADRPRHHEKWDGSGYPLRTEGRRDTRSARAFLRRSTVWMRWRPTGNTGVRCRWIEAMNVVSVRPGKSYDPKVVEILKTPYVQLENYGTKASTKAVS